MAFYKYCHSRDVEKIAAGSLRLSSLAWFRHLEDDEGDSEVGDRFEGLAETRIDPLFAERLAEDQRQGLERVGISITGNVSNITIGQSSMFQDCGHWLVFCVSESSELALDQSGYDACVEISDIHQLAECVAKAGSIGGKPISDFFDAIAVGKVEYTSRTANALQVRQQLAASPFVKRPKYQSQSEWRLALHAKDKYLPDIQYLTLVPPRGLLRVATASCSLPPRQSSAAVQTHESLARDLNRLIERVDQFNRAHAALDLGYNVTAANSSLDFQKRVARLDAASAKRQQEFASELRGEVVKAYWVARSLGVRGSWESHFHVGPLTPNMLGHRLAQLVDALVPGSAPPQYDGWVERRRSERFQ